MKKFFDRCAIITVFCSCVSAANATEFLKISQGAIGDGYFDQIKLTDNGSEFYTLSVISRGKEILRNVNLVPKGMKNSGGLEVFQGVSVADKNISLRYRFCSPSKGVCYDRNIISSFKSGQLFFLREEAVAAADKVAVSGVFYQQPQMLLASLSYQSLLENNDSAEKLFSDTYGNCPADLGGDSLTQISEELEKTSPSAWVLKKGCVTPALVFSLMEQNYLSSKAASRYLAISRHGSVGE